MKNRSEQLKRLRQRKYGQAACEGYGMTWYNFTIYFKIFVCIVTTVIACVAVMNDTGEAAIFVSALLYIVFSTSLIYTRYLLAHFKYRGITLYFTLSYFMPLGVNLFQMLYTIKEHNLSDAAVYFPSIVILSVFFNLELVYYKKRAHLFDKV